MNTRNKLDCKYQNETEGKLKQTEWDQILKNILRKERYIMYYVKHLQTLSDQDSFLATWRDFSAMFQFCLSAFLY